MPSSSYALLISALLLGGCAGSTMRSELGPAPQDGAQPAFGAASPRFGAEDPNAPARLVIPIQSKSNSALTGKAVLIEVAGGVDINIEISGAPPGKLATHIHQNGDCSAADASSAGDHFNPFGKGHALPPDEERHLGDLGNIEVGADGTGARDIMVKGATLKAGDPASFLGRAIVVDNQRDDGGTMTSGLVAGRLGCGVITPL